MTAAKYIPIQAAIDGISTRDVNFSQTDFAVAVADLLVEQASDVLALIAAVQALATPAPATLSTPSRIPILATTSPALAANAARKSALIFNDSAVVLFVGEFANASATNFTTALQPSATHDVKGYTGIVTIRGAKAGGFAQVTDRT